MPEKLVPVTVRATTAVGVDATFESTKIDLSLIFTGFGPLPAVTRTEEQTGSWDHVGVSRRPILSDGTSAYEEVTERVAPTSFAYEVSGFTNILGGFVHGARGSWTFTPTADGGTAIEWTYAFRPRRRRTLAVRMLIVPMWRAYMRRALRATVRDVESNADATVETTSAAMSQPSTRVAETTLSAR